MVVILPLLFFLEVVFTLLILREVLLIPALSMGTGVALTANKFVFYTYEEKLYVFLLQYSPWLFVGNPTTSCCLQLATKALWCSQRLDNTSEGLGVGAVRQWEQSAATSLRGTGEHLDGRVCCKQRPGGEGASAKLLLYP